MIVSQVESVAIAFWASLVTTVSAVAKAMTNRKEVPAMILLRVAKARI